MRLRALVIAMAGVGVLGVAGDAGGVDPASAVLDRELAAIANDTSQPIASLSVLAIRGGKVVFERQYGRRFISVDGKSDRPANANTMYRVASISKLVTTLGVMRLVEQGKLALDTDIGEYLGYEVRNPNFPDRPITLRMLLSHTSSLRDDAGYYTFTGDVDIKDVLQPTGAYYGDGAMWDRDHGPGTYFKYANFPWGVVATVMEKATGERFDALMEGLVLQPLGMKGGYDPARLPPERVAHIATLYRKANAGDVQVWDPAGPWISQVDDYTRQAPVPRTPPNYTPGRNGTLTGPQGGLRASAADLGRVMRMLVNGGEIDGRRFLQPDTVKAMFARQWETDGGANGDASYGGATAVFNAWGLGNQQFLDRSGQGAGDRLVEGGGLLAVGHHGDAYGLSGIFTFDPATGNGIVALASGTGFDPATARGTYSAVPRYEERVVTALWRRAVLGRAD